MRRKSLSAVLILFASVAVFAQVRISDLRWLDDGGDFAGPEWLSWSVEEKACYIMGAELAYTQMFQDLSRKNESTREKEFWDNFVGFKISLTKMIMAIDTFYADKANVDMPLMYVFVIERPVLQKKANSVQD